MHIYIEGEREREREADDCCGHSDGRSGFFGDPCVPVKDLVIRTNNDIL